MMAPLICWSFSSPMFRYRLVDHAVPAMWRSLAAARFKADWPSGNAPAAEHLKAIAAEECLPIVLCRADLTTERGLEQLERLLQEQSPHLSGLIHCAATGIHRPIEELTERHFDWTFNLNVRAFFKLTKLLMSRFSKGSSIVVVSSWGALRALSCYSLVGSSKGALEALARHLAV